MNRTNLKGHAGQAGGKAKDDQNSNNHGLIWLFLSFNGRLSRLGFLFGHLFLLIAGFASTFSSKVAVLFIALQVSIFWAGISLGVKRLHDKGLSGFGFLCHSQRSPSDSLQRYLVLLPLPLTLPAW
jgi:uncharacterized membrane protein YhaH (DUF805 family)